MNWTIVYTSSQPHLIEIVKSILEDNSIQFVTMDKSDSMNKMLISPGIELYVQNEDVLKTKKLLSDFEIE